MADGKKCAFVCVVGDSSEYPTVADFEAYLCTLNLLINETSTAVMGTVSRGGEVIVAAAVEK